MMEKFEIIGLNILGFKKNSSEVDKRLERIEK